MRYFENTVRFECECRLCGARFYYRVLLDNFVRPHCPRCGERSRLKCHIYGTEKEVPPATLITSTIVTNAGTDGWSHS